MQSPRTPSMAAAFAQPFAGTLPPLPRIPLDGASVRFVTHRSTASAPANNYEIDALLGMAIIKYSVASSVKASYPDMTAGEINKTVDSQVNKANMAKISGGYGLQGLLRGDAGQSANLRDSADVRSALFQAYVHGLHLNNPSNACKFLEAVFSGLIAAHLEPKTA